MNTGPGPLQVLLIEDHAVVRQGLHLLLEREGEFVVSGEAATLSEALAPREDPDATWWASPDAPRWPGSHSTKDVSSFPSGSSRFAAARLRSTTFEIASMYRFAGTSMSLRLSYVTHVLA